MPEFQLKNLTPNMMVLKVDETVDYYENLLGFQKVMSVPETGPSVWAMLKRNDVALMLQDKSSVVDEYPQFKDVTIGSTASFYIGVENIDALFESIKAKAKIVKAPHKTFYGKKEFAIEDNNGYWLIFSECCESESAA